MSDPRNLGSISPALLAGAGAKYWQTYVRIDFPSGTKRFTDRPGGDVVDIGDGHGSQTWLADRVFVVAPVSQTIDDPLEIQTIEFGNVDLFFTAYGLAPDGIRKVPIAIFNAWFDSTMALQGAVEDFRGYLDAADINDAGTITINIRPFSTSYLKQTPWRTVTTTDFPTLPPSGKVVHWGATEAAPLRTQTDIAPLKPPPPPSVPPRTVIIPAPSPAPPVVVGGR